MNVLLVRPEIEVGGVSTHLLQLAQALLARGHRVVAASGGGAWAHRLSALVPHVDDLVMAPSSPRVLGTAALRLARLVRREHIDVIHAHHRFASLVARAAGRLCGRRVVTTVHEMKNDRRWLTSLGLGERVITFSEAVRQHVIRTFGASASRVEVVRPGIHLAAPSRGGPRQPLQRALGLEGRSPLVGCIARMGPEKGHVFLVRALPRLLERIPSAHLVLVGDGPERALVEREAAALGVSSHLSVLGDRDDAAQLMAAMDLVVLPSLTEGLGLVVVEALLLERPVVATAVGGVVEVVESGVHGLLVPPRDASALADAMVRLLQDQALARACGQRGRRRAEAQFTVEEMARRTLNIYESLAARGR